MKSIILSLLAILVSIFLTGQEIYALEGETDKGINFSAITNISNNSEVISKDSKQHSQFDNTLVNEKFDASNSKLIAAMAYDPYSKSLFYMPMVSSNVYSTNLYGTQVKQLDGMHDIHVASCDEGSYFTRMSHASDGMIYALNNNASELIQINPKTNQITNLGALKMSDSFDMNNRLNGWGGDMVADDNANLYVVSASGNFFQVDIESLQTKFLGAIKDLPQNYTVNAAAVLNDGRILLANSKGKAMYTVSIENLSAEKYKETSKPTYDLASPYLAKANQIEELTNNQRLRLYPTIVSHEEVRLEASEDFGRLDVKVFDLNGFLVKEYQTNNIGDNGKEVFSLQSLSPNIYIVKVIDDSGVEVLNQKVTVVK